MNPGDYPLRSLQSRAAVRSLLAAREAMEGEGTLVQVRIVGKVFEPGRQCTCKPPKAGMFAMCRCFL